MKTLWRLRDFVLGMTTLANASWGDELAMLGGAGKLLGDLIPHDDWLPKAFAAPHAAHPQEYLLHCDPLERFCVVSFVLAPNQMTPVHDHTIWCLAGVMRGSVHFDEYRHEGFGAPMQKTNEHIANLGDIEAVSPTVGDIHRVNNALRDQVSIGIHVFGGNIGVIRRHKFLLPNGDMQPYVSGYANSLLPNIWGPLDGSNMESPEGAAVGLGERGGV